MDKCVEARKLIDNGTQPLVAKLNFHVGEIKNALEQAQQGCKNLDKVGSGNISAPDLLAGQPLEQFQKLHSFLGTCIQQIKSLQ